MLKVIAEMFSIMICLYFFLEYLIYIYIYIYIYITLYYYFTLILFCTNILYFHDNNEQLKKRNYYKPRFLLLVS